MEKGYVQVYTGNGKGKTTAAIGLSVRAVGAGLKVSFIQFMKGQYTSELESFKKLGIEFYQGGRPEFVIGGPKKEDIEAAAKTLELAKEKVTSGKYDVVVLDEVNVAIYLGLIKEEDILKLIKEKSSSTEIILTGRYATDNVMKMADLVTEMKEIKHYFNAGVQERVGIEK
ncbi:cob(I)yrinic acid a,c-diamide adenosyltransferase [Mesoaciditoga sp.]